MRQQAWLFGLAAVLVVLTGTVAAQVMTSSALSTSRAPVAAGNNFFALNPVTSCADSPPAPAPVTMPVPGRLANPGFENQPMRATVFYAGQARDASSRYGDCTPTSNLGLYTVHPANGADLKWSAEPASRTEVLDQMMGAGINVVVMSSWGPPKPGCGLPWELWAPMQTAPGAQDELFAAAAGKPILILPMIESYETWAFQGEFPQPKGGSVAPYTADYLIYLVCQYLKNAEHPEWAGSWAKIYDRSNPPEPRFAVAIMHAASDRLTAGQDAEFAAGFDRLADEVYQATGVHVGFLIDPLPPGTNASGSYLPDAERAGPYLLQADAILGIQAFIPEVWTSLTTDEDLIAWKRMFSQCWSRTGILFVMDVAPGYDGHLVFPPPKGHTPYGQTAEWRRQLAGMVAAFGQAGMVYNSWNGYTEAMVAVPNLKQGQTDLTELHWLTEMTGMRLAQRAYLPAVSRSPALSIEVRAAVARASVYLRTQYNSRLELLRESPITAPATYWLFTDNRLAGYALDAVGDSATAQNLSASIGYYLTPYGPLRHGLIETLGGERLGGPPRTSRVLEIRNARITGNVRVLTEIRDGSVMVDWDEYADLALYGALDAHNGNDETLARQRFDLAMQMWNGVGFDDKARRSPDSNGLYATYKLALAVRTAAGLGTPVDPALLKALLARQTCMGGFVSLYDASGEPQGDSNTETTSHAVLALAAWLRQPGVGRTSN
jgi:hypothetical protein